MNTSMPKANIVSIGYGMSMDMTFYQREDNSWPDKPNLVSPGGKIGNQAYAANLVGAKTTIVTLLGDDTNGKILRSHYMSAGISMKGSKMISGITTDTCDCMVDLDGNNKLYRHPDHNNVTSLFDEVLIEENRDVLLNADVVMTTLKAPMSFTEKLIDFCYINKILLVVTASNPEELRDHARSKELIERIGMIFCNQEEAQKLFGDEKSGPNMYPSKVVVTLGDNGLIYHDGNDLVHIPSLKTDVVNTVGAGDTLCGVFCASKAQRFSLDESLKRGICAATLKLAAPSTQNDALSFERLNEFIAAIRGSAKYDSIIGANSYEVRNAF